MEGLRFLFPLLGAIAITVSPLSGADIKKENPEGKKHSTVESEKAPGANSGPRTVYVESFNVENAEIKDVASMLAKMSGRSLVLTPRVRGKITLHIRSRVTLNELWDIFTRAINQLGYTVKYDRRTNTVYILSIGEIRRLKPTQGGAFKGEYAVSIVEPRYASPQDLKEAIRPLLSSYGRIFVLKPYPLVLIFDFESNIRAIEQLLPRLDRPDYAQKVKVLKFKYISPEDFEKAARPYIESQRRIYGSRIYYSLLPQRGIMVVSAPQEVLRGLLQLKERLDIPQPKGGNKPGFHIVKLKFVSVDEVAKSIERLLGKIPRKGKRWVFPSGLEISFDKTNNAILVFGTEEDFKNFEKLISLIDRRKKQVLLTATIIEASAKDILDKGIRWQILGSHGGVAFGATSREGLYEALSKGNFVMGALSASGTTVNIGGSKLFFPDLLLLYSLLEQGTGFKVISNPKVLTLDNQKAVIKVGQEVPFPTGIKYDVNGNPIITYDYKYVGLDLDVLPRISEKNLRLVINMKVQEVTGYLTNNVGGINYSVPITSTRELNSDVVVQNGQTIIIGGLISRKTLNSVSKVPILGDIPVIGNLFRSEHKEKDKTNLFIFITPYVISSPQELSEIMKEHEKLARKLFAKKKKEQPPAVKVEKNEEEVVLPYE